MSQRGVAGLRLGHESKQHLWDGPRTVHLVLTEQLAVLGTRRERVKLSFADTVYWGVIIWSVNCRGFVLMNNKWGNNHFSNVLTSKGDLACNGCCDIHQRCSTDVSPCVFLGNTVNHHLTLTPISDTRRESPTNMGVRTAGRDIMWMSHDPVQYDSRTWWVFRLLYSKWGHH